MVDGREREVLAHEGGAHVLHHKHRAMEVVELDMVAHQLPRQVCQAADPRPVEAAGGAMEGSEGSEGRGTEG